MSKFNCQKIRMNLSNHPVMVKKLIPLMGVDDYFADLKISCSDTHKAPYFLALPQNPQAGEYLTCPALRLPCGQPGLLSGKSRILPCYGFCCSLADLLMGSFCYPRFTCRRASQDSRGRFFWFAVAFIYKHNACQIYKVNKNKGL
jgi:hypothetical protein